MTEQATSTQNPNHRNRNIKAVVAGLMGAAVLTGLGLSGGDKDKAPGSVSAPEAPAVEHNSRVVPFDTQSFHLCATRLNVDCNASIAHM